MYDKIAYTQDTEPSLAQPSFDEACLLLGAEYVAVLLEDDPSRIIQLQKALILFAGAKAARSHDSRASILWPAVLKDILEAAFCMHSYAEQAQLLDKPLMHGNITPQKAHDLILYVAGSFKTVGPLTEENLARRLFTREIFIDDVPIVIDVR